MSILFNQILSLILVLALLGVPVVITVLLLRHFSKNSPEAAVDKDDYIIQKIRELEQRIEELEQRL
ncbi:hypothetical protein RH915_04295 [Serpentinicella sp. ANB-PHB4]|uniref:hypothetical protein n=1 Tax=Serpentinicella sp. ANB-PHB4 TaxID=3074076 RepID=UPI00286385D9|nr:hypothetical protein [Serpentinicella sp. ANB-PHB4]MDR5658703.1 hypothetical protein [Serpentinicella sp. ANB-PHB4]